MIYEWRKLLDKWSHENSNNYYDKCLNDASKILVTEAYTSTENTMRYYESADGQPGAHMPFNFQLIYIPKEATAQRIKQHIDLWLDNMPQGHTANWVVSTMLINSMIAFSPFFFSFSISANFIDSI